MQVVRKFTLVKGVQALLKRTQNIGPRNRYYKCHKIQKNNDESCQLERQNDKIRKKERYQKIRRLS